MSKNGLDSMIEDVQSRSGFGKVNYLDLNDEGKYLLRVLPLKEDAKDGGKKYPTYRVFIHSGFTNPNTRKRSTFKCIGTGCPLCAVAKQKKQAGDPNAWSYGAKLFYLYNVIDAGGNLKILKASGKLHEHIEEEWLSKAKGEKVNIFDSQTGSVIQISRRGKGQETKWDIKTAHEVNPLSQKILDALENSQPLNEVTMTYTKEQLDMVAKGVSWKSTPTSSSEDKNKYKQVTSKVEDSKSENKRPPQRLVDVSAKQDMPEEKEAANDSPVDHGPEILDEELVRMRSKIFGGRNTK